MNTALAYFNWGRWVVDCPQPGCTDAREVRPPQLEDVCAHGHPFRIVMPADAAAITAELRGRIRDSDKAWYPSGHVRAVAAGFPTGQTVEELRAESQMIRQVLAARQAKTNELVQVLDEFGISVGPDGHFEGRV